MAFGGREASMGHEQGSKSEQTGGRWRAEVRADLDHRQPGHPALSTPVTHPCMTGVCPTTTWETRMDQSTFPFPGPFDRRPRQLPGESPLPLPLGEAEAAAPVVSDLAPSDRGHREALAHWLHGAVAAPYPWDAWCTFTFGPAFGVDGPSPDRALYHFRGWRSRACRRAPCFAAVETGSQGGRSHVHALLRLEEIPRSAAWRSWFKRYGRAQILPYDAAKGLGATFYISKYLTKAPLHWDIWNFNDQ